MKKKKGRVLILAGIFLIAAAAVWSAYNVYEGLRAGRKAADAVQHLEEIRDPQESSEAPSPSVAPEEETEMLSESAETEMSSAPTEAEIPDYILNPNMEMPVVSYEGEEYIGILEIPALDLKLPVISQWSYPSLKKSPCRYVGSAYTDNMVIAAHNYASHFGNLGSLQEGAAVVFTDVDGNVFNYRVELKETLNPQDVGYMTDGGWDLSLFTCTPGGSYRVTVRCTSYTSYEVF